MSKVRLFDTHCHIHDSDFAVKFNQHADEMINEAVAEGVDGFICVGTDVKSSIEAISFVQNRDNCFATVALHPHEAAERSNEQLNSEISVLQKLVTENVNGKILAIGECGLDYYYHESAKVIERQKNLLKLHIELALEHNLPLVFHVRDPIDQNSNEIGRAFKDFFEIVDLYENVRGVVHSFSAGTKELEGIINRGLLIGLNGIMTFTKQTSQLNAAKSVPLEKLVLETDAPFLTPEPFRGKMCKPKYVRVTAQFLSDLRSESFEKLTEVTTNNAKQLFGIK